jgi:uncharacterized protein (TIGR02117 family)
MSEVKLALAGSDDKRRPARGAEPRRSLWRSIGRYLGLGLLILAGLLAIATIATARWGDRSLWPPAPGAPTTEVFVVSHGYHSGIIVSRQSLVDVASRRGLDALGQIAARFASFNWLEIGWGEERFYREVPTIEFVTAGLAARALLQPGNASVLHVVGFENNPRAAFANSDLVRLDLSDAGFERLADKLDASFARDGASALPLELGPGLFSTSLFFRANGSFHLFNVCNHWTAGLIDAAGVPTAPVPATLPVGLLLDLEWRSGLARLPRPSARAP